MRRLSIFSFLLVLTLAFVACKKDKDDDDNNNNNNNDQIPDTEVNVVTKRGGNTLDQSVVELKGNQFIPAGWTVVSGYNNAANTFSFSMISQSSSTGFDYQLNMVQMVPSFSEGSFSLAPQSGGFGATSYRNITVDSMEVYLATSGTFTVDKLKVIGQANGVSANYIDGSFNFTAQGQQDTTDVINVEATFTGLATPET